MRNRSPGRQASAFGSGMPEIQAEMIANASDDRQCFKVKETIVERLRSL